MTTEPRPLRTYLSQRPSRHGRTAVIGFLALVFSATQAYWSDAAGLRDLWVAQAEAVFQRAEWWRPWTAVLVHADLQHVLSNAFMIAILGYFVAGYYGPRVFPFLGVLCAGWVNVLSLLSYEPEVRLLGASGLAYWLAGFWLALYWGIATNKTPLQRTLRSVGVVLGTLFPSTFEPEISYRTHFNGFVMGVLIGAIYFFSRREFFRAHEVYPAREELVPLAPADPEALEEFAEDFSSDDRF